MIKEKEEVVSSNSLDFKRLVLQYGRKSLGRKITYNTFENWLKRNGYLLAHSDTNWRAIFNSLLTHNFCTFRSYRTDKDSQLVTVFKVTKA